MTPGEIVDSLDGKKNVRVSSSGSWLDAEPKEDDR